MREPAERVWVHVQPKAGLEEQQKNNNLKDFCGGIADGKSVWFSLSITWRRGSMPFGVQGSQVEEMRLFGSQVLVGIGCCNGIENDTDLGRSSVHVWMVYKNRLEVSLLELE
jgi:hypothetical protein